MNSLAASPFRNLISVLVFVAAVVVLATLAYMSVGWSFTDAAYMVILTVTKVGLGEVHPINTPFLHAVTIGTMVLSWMGMALLTPALIQVFTYSFFQQILGENRVKTDINKLKGHVIVCGFGRIGVMLAKDLAAGGSDFVILEREETRLTEARSLGYLCWQGDATDETSLTAVGIQRASTLATVLPDDAANVFITLSARSLNPGLKIIARGELPSTEIKLIRAGADKVVMPTHIGAERIAQMILFPETARLLRESHHMRELQRVLPDLGLEIELVIVAEKTVVDGITIGELERRAKGGFVVVQLNRKEGQGETRPAAEERLEAGDGLVILGKVGSRLHAIFSAPATRPRVAGNIG
jgi:voltage-gated potassium channel